MGANFDPNSTGGKISRAGLGAAAGGLTAASGSPSQIDFSALANRFKRKSPSGIYTIGDTTNKVPRTDGSLPPPDTSYSAPNQLPDTPFTGINNKKPPLLDPNSMPFFGGY